MKRFIVLSVMMISIGIGIVECGRISGGALSSSCEPTGFLHGNSHDCNRDHGSDCCQSGKEYPQYKCSPAVTGSTAATLTLNGFQKNEDGGGPSECDGQYHNDSELVVALSTGWYAGGSRCLNYIQITNPDNGRSVRAKVVDECDSMNGCDADHDYQPPCNNNVVDASPGVWKALGVPDYNDVGEMHITWTDA